MNKQFISRHKFSVICAVPCLLCAVWFLFDPSLNLSYIMTMYPTTMSNSISQYFPLFAYLLSLATIILACYLTFRFGVAAFLRWLGGIVILFMALSWYTEFPALGQLSFIWTDHDVFFTSPVSRYTYLYESLTVMVSRYTYLFDWLIAWIITLALYIAILIIIQKRREKGSTVS